MNKSYYELEIKVYNKDNMHEANMYEKLAKLNNFSFKNSQILSCLHTNKGLKHYSFSGLYPIEQDRVYKEDEIYSYLFRTYNENMAHEFLKCIKGIKNDDFVVTDVIIRSWKHRDIKYVDSLTPTVITLKDGLRWNKDIHGIEIAKEQIFKNLIRKYNSLNNTNFTFNYCDIIKEISLKNKSLKILNYKGIKILGYKLRVEFQENNIAQEIANLSVVNGIGEKNSSFGMGFVKPYFR